VLDETNLEEEALKNGMSITYRYNTPSIEKKDVYNKLECYNTIAESSRNTSKDAVLVTTMLMTLLMNITPQAYRHFLSNLSC